MIWDEEFATGQWEYLNNTSEDIIYGYLGKYLNNGRILDLGCGSGNTGNELDISLYSNYTGVDISEVATRRAEARSMKNGRRERNEYFCSAIASFAPRMNYDVILFRESIFYIPLSRIEAVLERYSAFLSENGVFVVKMCDRKKYSKIVQLIESNHRILEMTPSADRNVVLIFR
ncbi:MAG: class I SAM-dependent methyltransferase [Nitrospira sp.]|nr:class I SAM-dependent methyltransferase [Nitrospira sp.]